MTRLTGIRSGPRHILLPEQTHVGQPPKGPLDIEPENTGSNSRKEIEYDPQATSWEIYNEKVAQEGEFVRSIHTSMDGLLIFAGLFSATASAFLQFTWPLLQEDKAERSNDLLLALFHKMENSSNTLPERKPFVVPAGAWAINCLVFASIAGTLISAFFAILVKQWAADIIRGLTRISTPQLRARTHQFRIQGVYRFQFARIAAFVPVIVHLSLACFSIGIVEFLIYSEQRPLAAVVIACSLLGVGAYFLLSLLPLVYLEAPFQSPLTAIFRSLGSSIRRLFSLCFPRLLSSTDLLLNEIVGEQDPVSRHIHLSWALDVDVLVSLVGMADKRTERRVLEQALIDLQRLIVVRKRAPQLLLSPVLMNTYLYLVSTMIQPGGTVSLAHDREPRARSLCHFLIWLGSISAENNLMQHLRQLLEYNPSFVDHSVLPIALRAYGLKYRHTEDVVSGDMAVRELGHINQNAERECTACVDFVVHTNGIRTSTNPHSLTYNYLMTLQPDMWDIQRGRAERERIIGYIAAQTRCLARFAPLTAPSNLAYARMRNLIIKFRLGDPALAYIWSETVPGSTIEFTNPHLSAWISEIEAQRALQA